MKFFSNNITARSVFTTFVVVLILGLPGCALQQSDEDILKQEFKVPAAAVKLMFRDFPEKSGWVREGLRIDLAFQLNEQDFQKYLTEAKNSGPWKPLPMPREFLMSLGRVKSTKAAIKQSFTNRQENFPPEGSVHNPSEAQLYQAFCQNLPLEIRQGFYQCRTAGDDILHRPKVICNEPQRDLNDFMLAILDVEHKQLLLKVNTQY